MAEFCFLAVWDRLRQAFRDDSYERYLERHAREAPGEPPLDRFAFKKAQALGNIGRCCGG